MSSAMPLLNTRAARETPPREKAMGVPMAISTKSAVTTRMPLVMGSISGGFAQHFGQILQGQQAGAERQRQEGWPQRRVPYRARGPAQAESFEKEVPGPIGESATEGQADKRGDPSHDSPCPAAQGVRQHG